MTPLVSRSQTLSVCTVLVALVLLLPSFPGANSQGDGLQFNSVVQLRRRRNTDFLETCPMLNQTYLSCTVRDNSLANLRSIAIKIETCGSSISSVFTFTDMPTNDETKDLQCPKTISLGELSVTFEFNVFNESQFIVIGTTMRARIRDRDILLFNTTNLTLSAQFPIPDNCPGGIVCPPTSCPIGAGAGLVTATSCPTGAGFITCSNLVLILTALLVTYAYSIMLLDETN